MGYIRLDKYLADAGIGSRTEVKQIIKKGRIDVNGIIMKSADYKVDIEKDCIEADGKKIQFESNVYYMLHKPAGCVSATEDNLSKTVLDYLHSEDSVKKQSLFPVGRLDKDTEGLLLITNDGALAHKLLSPKKHVDKTYYVIVEKSITKEAKETLEKGVSIGDEKPTLPARLDIIDNTDSKEVKFTITEGRFHQIKRMFHAVDNCVVYLKRLSMGTLVLDKTLKPGDYRRLTEEEIKLLRENC